ncbi:hypothetical protein MMC39_00225 [Anabaena sp. CCAP 1446/1C]|nr:hypothetical protein [Anabaena sp. CCAP 1446/1C]BAY01435.1 serine/threonine kinase [Anabaena cylindrica PCC 7122]
MEYIDGETLFKYVQNKGQLSELEALIAIPKLMKYTPPALSRTLPLVRGGLGRGNFVSN